MSDLLNPKGFHCGQWVVRTSGGPPRQVTGMDVTAAGFPGGGVLYLSGEPDHPFLRAAYDYRHATPEETRAARSTGQMTDIDIRDYLDGFIAWDGGATDSGIKDDRKRENVRAHLVELADKDAPAFRKLVMPLIARGDPYVIEDMQGTLNWLLEFLGFDDWGGM